MTLEEKLDLLRKADVIDMTLSFGCFVVLRDKLSEFEKLPHDGGKYIILNETNTRRNGGIKIYEMVECGFLDNGDFYYGNFDERKVNRVKLEYIESNGNILGHDLLYGRVCRWIEENKETIHTEEADGEDIDYVYPYYCIDKTRYDFMDLWHSKDLPLSQQDNIEEIVDFIISLLPEGH